MLSTKELCEQLGVSRSWVNRYLREQFGVHMSRVDMAQEESVRDFHTVFYNEHDIVSYLNSHAVFCRQTEKLNVTKYIDKSSLNEIEKLPEEQKREAYLMAFKQSLPDVTVLTGNFKNFCIRKRGGFPWKKIKCHINSLDELHTMAELKGDTSEELVYRDNFSQGCIRVQVHGRTWFMDDKETPSSNYTVLVAARDI